MTSDQPPSSGAPPDTTSSRRQDAEPPQAEPAGAAKDAPAAYAAEAVSPWSEPGTGPNAQPEPSHVSSVGGARRRSAWPLIGAGLVGGALVAAVLALAGLLTGRDDSADALNARLLVLEQQVHDLDSRPPPAGNAGALTDLLTRLARLEAAVAAPRPAATDPALVNRISAIEGEVKALVESVGVLGRRSDEAATAARDARARADANAAAVAELSQKLAAQGPAVDRGALDALSSRVTAIERGEKAVETELAKRPPAEVGDRAARLALAASALNAAVERGDPFAAELATAKSLAADPQALAPLEPFANSGVPSAAALSRELAALVPSLRAAAGSAPHDGGIWKRLQANAEKLVRIHPLQEVPGGDNAAIIARIEAKAGQAGVAGALAELAQLPAPARVPAEPWIKQAQARSAALAASRRLASDALAGLGK